MVGLLSLESRYGRPKMRNSERKMRKIKRQEIGRDPVGYDRFNIFMVSVVMRSIQS